jgi:hypothetical protein
MGKSLLIILLYKLKLNYCMSNKEISEIKISQSLDVATFDFDSLEQSVSAGLIGFGNPHSRLTAHEQILLWKEQTIQAGQFPDRDEFCSTMATY